MNGIVLTVLIGQLPTILGFSVSGDDAMQRAIALIPAILEGRINWIATAVGLTCLFVILACKRWATKVPGVLIAVVSATVVVWLLDLDERSDLSIIGSLPQGLPGVHTPVVSVSDFRALLSGALAIALVSFADMSVLSRTYAQRGGYNVDANQEFIALGIANLATGLFQGFPVSSSASRTPVAESAGAKTQLAGIVGASCIAVLLIFAPTFLNTLPHAALAAVVISACLGLIEISGVVRVYRLRPSELTFSIVCFLGVILVGAIEGIFIAVAMALLAFIWRAWRPYDAVLGRVDGLKGYHDISRHPEAKQIPGLVLYRWDAPLFFANAAVFQEHILQAVADAPTPTTWVVVAAEPVTDIDITAADMLSELDQRLHQSGIELCFAEMKGPVKDRLQRYGLFASFGTENFFPTIGRAVGQFLAEHQVEWRDWEDQS
jgi:MFS superfamily sulfate permease-like transporter